MQGKRLSQALGHVIAVQLLFRGLNGVPELCVCVRVHINIYIQTDIHTYVMYMNMKIAIALHIIMCFSGLGVYRWLGGQGYLSEGPGHMGQQT